MRFPHAEADFDLSVEYERNVVRQLSHDYGRLHSQSRSDRYENQLGDFMATLPLYLGRMSSDGHRVWSPALAFPEPPQVWSGFVELRSLQDLPRRLAKQADSRLSDIREITVAQGCQLRKAAAALPDLL